MIKESLEFNASTRLKIMLKLLLEICTLKIKIINILIVIVSRMENKYQKKKFNKKSNVIVFHNKMIM